MSKPKVLSDKLIKVRHLRKYVKEVDHREEFKANNIYNYSRSGNPVRIQASHKLYTRQPV